MSTNFLGIAVEGDIQYSRDQNVPQKTQAELAPLLLDVLNDPIIAAVGWTQYTPYFNDGEPCVFSVREPSFLCVGDDDTTDRWDRGVDYGTHPVLGEHNRSYNRVTNEWDDHGYTGNHEASHSRARALSKALQSGAFNAVLLEAFGDHADIKATRDGITVEYYEHD